MEKIKVFNPYDNSIVGEVEKSEIGEIEEVFRRAEKGLMVLKEIPPYSRSEILYKAANYIREHKEEFARTLVREVGKTIREARGEVDRAIQTLTLSAEEGKRICGETVPFDSAPTGGRKIGYYKRVPIGIVLAITPFNFPLNLVCHKIGPAIAAGCSVILKPATKTPLSALNLKKALYSSGLPQEVLSIVIGSGEEIGDILVKDKRPRMITFTGSKDVGMRIAERAGMKRLTLELGSNSACIIFKDADLKRAAQKIRRGGFSLAGQVCISVQRVYVEESIFKDFLDIFVSEVESIKVGDPGLETTDMGPMISPSAVERVMKWIEEAEGVGGRVVTGGERDGNFLLPTVIVDVSEKAKLIQREAFAPLVVVNRFKEIGEAIEKVNGTEYGLQAGVFTKDIDKALRCAEEIECGGVLINEIPTFRVDLMPYGGMKGSGIGREGPKFTIEEMTEPKLILFDYS